MNIYDTNPELADLLWESLEQLRKLPLFELRYERNRQDVLRDTLPMNLQCETIEPHVLFRFSAWRRCYDSATEPFSVWSQSLYDDPIYNIDRLTFDRMYPALQLATLMMQRTRPFFVRLLFCPVSNQEFDKLWVPEQSHYDLLDDVWNYKLAMDFRIFPGDIPSKTSLNLGHCRTHHHFDAGAGATPKLGTIQYKITIAIAAETLQFINSNDWLAAPEVQRANVLVVLATTLVHELAHATWKLRQCALTAEVPADQKMDTLCAKEPRVYPEGFQELGFSCELFLHGGLIFPGQTPDSMAENRLSGRPSSMKIMDGSGGIDFIVDLSEHKDKSWRHSWTLSLESVCDFFRVSTWSDRQQIFYLLPYMWMEPLSRLPLLPAQLRAGCIQTTT